MKWFGNPSIHCHKFPSNDVHGTLPMYCKSTVKQLFSTKRMLCKFIVLVPYSENVP